MPLRGEVWEVNLDPVVGREQAKIRPCVIVSNDSINTNAGISIVLPISGTALLTQSGKLSPLLVLIAPNQWTGLKKESYSYAHQIRTVSHERFKRKIGELESRTMDRVTYSVLRAVSAA